MSPTQPGRNDPCPCDSGKKYKKCCEGKQQGWSAWALLGLVGFGLVLLLGAVALWFSMTAPGGSAPSQRGVWSPEHGHYHD